MPANEHATYSASGVVYVYDESDSVVRQEIAVFRRFVIDGDEETASPVDIADGNDMRRSVRTHGGQSPQFIPLKETFLSFAELHQTYHSEKTFITSCGHKRK